MNKIYKSIYNEVLGTWVAISEVAKSGGKKSKSRMMSSVAVGLVMACAGVAGEAWGFKGGASNNLTGTNSSAVGENNNVNGNDSVAFGAFNRITNERAGALGIANYNESKQSFTYGFLNYGIGVHGTAIGNYNFAVGANSHVFGTESYSGDISLYTSAKNKNTVDHATKSGTLTRLGNLMAALKTGYSINSVTNAKNGLAIGQYSFAFDNYSVAMGNSTISSGEKSLALGNAAVSLNSNDIAIGTNALAGFSDRKVNEITYGNNKANKIDNALLGKNARFSDAKKTSRPKLDGNYLYAEDKFAKALDNSDSAKNGAKSQIAIGEDTVAMGRQVLAVGATNRVFGRNSSAVGKGNFAHGDAAQAFGNWNIAYGSNTVAVGNRNDSTGAKSLAVGFENRAYGEHTTALGYSNTSEAAHSTAVGHTNSVTLGEYSNAFGFKNTINKKGSNAIGSHNTVSGISSIAFGSGNEITGNHSIALGSGVISGDHENSSVSDKTTVSGNYSISIGHQNTINDDKTVAFGNSVNSGGASNSVILGHESTGIMAQAITGPVKVAFGGVIGGIDVGLNWAGPSNESNGSVSVGAVSKERQIKNVATGAVTETSTDAINGSQLYAAIKAVGEVSLILKGDSTNLMHRKLGETISFHGGANQSNLTSNNIGVNVEGDSIQIKLSKSISEIDSIVTAGGTTLNDNGLVVSGGPSVTNNGIDANNISIKNVGDGINPTDAANVKNVTDAINKLRDEGYTFIGSDATSHKFTIGKEISLKTDENLNVSVVDESLKFALKKDLQNLNSIQILNGPKLDSSGLVVNENVELTSDGLKVANNIKLNSNGLTAGVVSIDPNTGKITGVARPDAPGDAVNLEYLTESLNALPPGEINYAGNEGGNQTLSLGKTLTVKGNSSFGLTDEGANIATKSNDGEIIIGLNKNLTGLESASIGGNTIDNTGLSVLGGPSITKEGIDANSKPIRNVGTGTNDSDAANMQNVKDAVENAVSDLTSKGIIIGANSGNQHKVALGEKLTVEGKAEFNDTDEGENISTQVNDGKILIGLKKSLINLDSVAIKNGPTIDSTGIGFENGTKFGPDQLNIGSLTVQNGTISGLITPTNDDHAVNKKFVDDTLKAEVDKLTNAGIKFIGNDGTVQTIALGQTIKVKGTAAYSETDIGANIATQSENGEIIIGLKKSITGIESVTTQGGTKLSDNGLEVAGGPSVTKDGINANAKPITNVGEGSADTDAANIKKVKDTVESAVSNLTSKGIKLGGNDGDEQTLALGDKLSVEGKATFSNTDEGENISTQVSAGKILIGLKKALTNIDSVAINNGPKLNNEGLDLGNGNKIGKDSIKLGSLTLNSNGSISGVGEPTDADHAVNKKFVEDALESAVSGLTTGGIKFAGNEGTITTQLGDTVNIVGAETVFANTDEGKNIATKSEEGKISIGLKKNLSGLDSAEIGGNTIDAEGFKVDGGPTVTKEGINANGKKISNVLADDNSGENDVANVKYVKDKVDALKEQGYMLSANEGTDQKFAVGSTIAFKGDDNITTEVSAEGVKIKLKPTLTNMNSVVIKDGPTLNKEGLKFSDDVKFGPEGLKVGSVQITPNGQITGLETPNGEKDAANKGYVDTQVEGLEGKLSNLQNNPLKFVVNEGEVDKKLGESISIKGDDNSTNKEDFDLTNVMTWFDTNGVLRIGVRKALKLSTIKAEDPTTNKSSELKPNSLVFNGVDGKEGKDGTVTLDVTTNGTPDVTGATTPRLRINDVDIATLNDGMKFAANAGTEQNVKLNKTVTIKGAEGNANEADFDGGENIMTKVEQDGEGVKFTVAFKKAPEFADLTVGGPKAGDKTPHITLKDKDNKEKFSASVDEEGNGIVSVTGSDPENKTDLMHDGLSINDADGFSKLGTNADGKGGLASPDTNKRRMTHTYNDASNNVVTEEIATLDDGLKFEANATDGNGNAKLNSKVKIAGADENKEWSEFDEGANIMTKVENTPDGETVIRVAMRKDLKLKNGSFGGDGADGLVSIKKEDGKDGITIDPSVIHFNNIPNKPDADGNPQNNGAAGITLTQNGTPDLKSSEPVTRIQITDASGNPTAEVATMNDGLRFTANVGDEKANTLNSKVSVAGHKKNTEWDKFDTGSNIMTKIDQNEDGETEITVALKRDIELSSAVIGHGEIPAADGNPAVKGKDGQITLNNKEGETAITINAGNAPATSGPSISVNKPRSDEGTKLTSDGIEISKKSPTASKPTKTLVSIAPEGSGRVQDADEVKKPRLTMTSGEGADANVEEIATMNDGLRFKGDTADLLNKPLSNILTLIGGESDAKKLTSLEDQNIGVIAEDVAPKGSRAPAEKVLTVRMSKNLKGLQSAEFKPVDESANATGQSIRIGAGGVNIAKGDKSVQLNEDGLKVGENGPSVTNEGINAGGMSIANVGAPMQSNHAANKGYVDGELAKMQGQLGNKIQETRKDALGASAMAMATAGLPQAYQPGKSAFAVAGGVVAGQSAFAMGISSISDNGKWIIKGSVSSDSRSQVGGSIGAAYQW